MSPLGGFQLMSPDGFQQQGLARLRHFVMRLDGQVRSQTASRPALRYRPSVTTVARLALFGLVLVGAFAAVQPTALAAPSRPTVDDTDPNSPANDNNPEVKGTADAGT